MHLSIGKQVGLFANAMLLGFMQKYKRDDRLFFNVKAKSAYPEKVGSGKARTMVDMVGVAASGEEFRLQDYLMAGLWTRADPRTTSQHLMRDKAIAEGRGLAGDYFMDRGWGYDVDIRSLPDAEKELMKAEVAAAQVAGSDMPPEVRAKLSVGFQRVDYNKLRNEMVDGYRMPLQVSEAESYIGLMSGAITIDSLVASFVEKGITGGYPDPGQFDDMLGPDQYLMNGAIVLNAAFGDDPIFDKYRDQLLDRTSKF